MTTSALKIHETSEKYRTNDLSLASLVKICLLEQLKLIVFINHLDLISCLMISVRLFVFILQQTHLFRFDLVRIFVQFSLSGKLM